MVLRDAVLSLIARFYRLAICANEPAHYNRKFIAEIDIFTTLCCGLCNVKTGGLSVIYAI